MAFKIILFFTILTLAASQYHADHHHLKYGSLSPVLMKNYDAPIYNERKTPGSYDFSYSVHDDHTKDIKSRMESHKDGIVKGHYDMIDSDGYKRIVDYTADDTNGFQASVHREKTDIRVPTPTVTYNQKQYYHSEYPKHSPVHHQIVLPIYTTPKSSNIHTSYTEQVKPNHLKPYHMDISGHLVKLGKPNGRTTYSVHSLKPDHMGLSQYKVDLKKPSDHINYVEHSVKPHHMSLSMYSAEPKQSNRHTAVYSEHTLKDHHIQIPVQYTEPQRSMSIYSDNKKSFAVNKMDHKTIGKHTSPRQSIASKYFIPVENKERIPIKTQVLYNDPKPTLAQHHAKTHVVFHGVNANYEY